MTTEEKRSCQSRIKEKILSQASGEDNLSDDELLEHIEEYVFEIGREVYLSVAEKKEMITEIFNSLRRLDVLQEIIENPDITEIMVNGADHIFVEEAGKLRRYPKTFSNREKLEDVIQQIVSGVNRRVNEANPIVDARLSSGERVNVVLPPVAMNGPILTIRKFPDKPLAMENMIEYGSITEEAAEFLEMLVKAKYNIFISGGTGSGKTTMLNILSGYIPDTERIITIEDAAELQIQGIPNLVRLEARDANVEGKNAVTIRDLMKSALRMRPDRIILGEVRDSVAYDMLSAMGTGHDGSLCTGHANSPKDMLCRLETLVLTGIEIPLAAVRNQIASALDIVIQIGRLRDKSRKVLEIDEVIGIKDGEVELIPLFRFRETGMTEEEKIVGQLERTKHSLFHKEKLAAAGYFAVSEYAEQEEE